MSTIQLSKAAIKEIVRLKSKQPNPDALFRLGVQPGGCAGFYYTVGFDEVVNPGDRVHECHEIRVVIDVQSTNYTNGIALDYSEDLMGGGFRFHNPNAVQSCGCGNSFSIAEQVQEQ